MTTSHNDSRSKQWPVNGKYFTKTLFKQSPLSGVGLVSNTQCFGVNTFDVTALCHSGIRIPGKWATLLCPFLTATGLGLAGSAQQGLLLQPPGYLIKTYNQDKQPLTLVRIAVTENAMTEK